MKNIDTEVKVRVAARKIQLPEEILSTHAECYQHGDYSTISEMAYKSSDYAVKVRRAIKSGIADKVLWDAIVKFYKEVMKHNEQIMSEYDHND